jgi:hypothetical protein
VPVNALLVKPQLQIVLLAKLDKIEKPILIVPVLIILSKIKHHFALSVQYSVKVVVIMQDSVQEPVVQIEISQILVIVYLDMKNLILAN